LSVFTFTCGLLNATHVFVSIVGVPSQVSFVESKRAPVASLIGPSGVELATIAMAVPSFGAML
jgi:hypothetical protein